MHQLEAAPDGRTSRSFPDTPVTRRRRAEKGYDEAGTIAHAGAHRGV